ncbi:MFS transporter [Streptomyces collinus]|uniref:Putative proline/betaine transporter n=1 Tax=Streptomyces collinus (strain DSM 40733 / Tue 365) TaxID=1214242 RepID=S5VEA6_STRC3|nr:MFS transporter [Streptomyces collinus]AGS68867.1 transmembrane efflux protein [Streptomyces collinus Tu 365]UJA07506.1 MFS transporter [Streptomyces collinus]UJA17628.1 MFS transporter [Streptomyces collinus]
MPRLAAASLAGTAIEFYDFFVYGTAAALVLGPLFFPGFSPLAGTLAAFVTFGVGFVARPLGSVLFGHLGDRRGRRPVLVVSLLLTGASTVAVGCVPAYGSIGVAAPVLLLVLRFLQGLGLGGEWGGAVLLTAEHAPAGRRALWSSFPQVGPALGFVLANGVMLALSAGLSEAQFAQWGWRVPFWAAAVPALAGLWLRSSLPETPRFLEIDDHARVPLVEVVRHHGRLVLLAAGALAAGYAVFYAVTTWSLAYATQRLGVSRTVMLTCVMGAVVVKGALTPLLALLGDRFGRRPLCLTGCAVCAVWMLPMVSLLATGEPLLMFLGILGALIGFITMFAVIAAYLPELFEARVRCTGASVGYNLGGVVGGALTPVVATALAAHGGRVPWGVGVYLTGICLLSLGCFALLPETRPAPAPAMEAEADAATG